MEKTTRVVSLAIIIGCDEKLLKKILKRINKLKSGASWISGDLSLIEEGIRKFFLFEKKNFLIIATIYQDDSCGLSATDFKNIPRHSILMSGEMFLKSIKSLQFNENNSIEI